jgi:hypothetical protein
MRQRIFHALEAFAADGRGDVDNRRQAYRLREFSRTLAGGSAERFSRRDDAWYRKIPLRIRDPSLSAQQTTAKSGAALARGQNAPCESVGPRLERLINVANDRGHEIEIRTGSHAPETSPD